MITEGDFGFCVLLRAGVLEEQQEGFICGKEKKKASSDKLGSSGQFGFLFWYDFQYCKMACIKLFYTIYLG